jgi:hypothetical protein
MFRLLCSLVWLSSLSEGFAPTRAFVRNTALQVDQGVDLSLLGNFESDAEFLKRSVKKWLDDEFIEQPVHGTIGNLCADIYKRGRSENVTDLGEMLLLVGSSLEGSDLGDAFVNCWDIANRVSDLLMVRLNRELCSCAGDLTEFYAPSLAQAVEELQTSEFQRYRWLQLLLEGELPLERAQSVLTVCLGFLDEGGGLLRQDQSRAPLGWENLNVPPDFADLRDTSLDARLEADQPEDPGGVDIALEMLVGLEFFKSLKKAAETDAAVRRRVGIVKWLYVTSFINDFPYVSGRFIPAHLAYRLDEY